jgi:hypothetical protein
VSRRHAIRAHERHCILCYATEVDAPLERHRNGITRNVTTWCVDAVACRKRHRDGAAYRAGERDDEPSAPRESRKRETGRQLTRARTAVHWANVAGAKYPCGARQTNAQKVAADADGVTCPRCRRLALRATA